MLRQNRAMAQPPIQSTNLGLVLDSTPGFGECFCHRVLYNICRGESSSTFEAWAEWQPGTCSCANQPKGSHESRSRNRYIRPHCHAAVRKGNIASAPHVSHSHCSELVSELRLSQAKTSRKYFGISPLARCGRRRQCTTGLGVSHRT